MGVFECPLRLEAVNGRRSLELRALVDTGASYTIVPAGLLRDLGVDSIERIRLEMADGRASEYDMGRAIATAAGRTEATLVVFGADDGPVLLGAYTLQGLRLGVDPVHHRLVPATGMRL